MRLHNLLNDVQLLNGRAGISLGKDPETFFCRCLKVVLAWQDRGLRWSMTFSFFGATYCILRMEDV